ncbi:hypothetical protein I3843_14G094300 [Carya illinoinensis]|uniref:uncharacterized protein LOC122294506 isoform X1 n=1 Tax=Carya illinoinensis TaxID=32201 RepID=UPI001C72684E|nr:uncharacterized protein LOC122294506 isoform X1 [Carya illinoinensis]XP_042959226.1 uncharacterized protein LOC122294506 isoform X1 [Carya illinoinensis]XP_042959227.1 uncharacterized protein LOC122294506 isoform X1 [Carya illinoinensis]XP_042959228.1 uncharacterized protein LOC122294506 isoform X1 [Carya illinoinensis]KAG7947449.1 hypothetical protein I3843_14G094300 [Carya illinoinensis]
METNTSPLELLTNDNYVDWSVKMKNNLLAQGLWDIVERGSKPPKLDDHVVEYEAWRKMNDVALHAIQSSCGMDILSRINKISSAKIVWETLAKMFIKSNGQDKIKQAEDDDLIIDEGNSSRSDNTGPRGDAYAALLKAVRKGDWNSTKEFLKLHPGALTERILFTGGTVLHAAVTAEQEHIVVELVNMISEHDLATMQDYGGRTALHETTASGNYRMAECLITKNKSLVSIRDDGNTLPVVLAMDYGHKELARYLYSQTPFEDLESEKGRHGATLLNSSIYNRDLDMALLLMERCPRLAFAFDGRGISPLEVLAVLTDAFESGKGMVFWKQWIYNHCIYISMISLARVADQFRLNIQNYQEKTIGSADLWHQLVSSLLNLLGFKRLYEMKLVRLQFQQLLSSMCEAIPANTSLKKRRRTIAPVIFRAISRGNFEFVHQIVQANSDLLSITDAIEGRGMFNRAVLHRQHRIFSLIYSLKRKNVVLNRVDNSGNTILHMAGMLTEHTPIDHIRGAALQMQREVQWFKEVERICPLSDKEYLNNDGLTPRQLFTKDHQTLRKEGERWMKDTATSCTVVGALIITVMFTAAFTNPGGNNQETGLPILMHDKLFKLFIITDSLSLFSSSTSVLMFLGILTSRYAEEDFLRSLPSKMIIGLFALFFSITTMMIAFSAALLLMFSGKYRIAIPIISLAGVPIILFVLVQFRLLVDMLVSTYGLGIFNRKMKPWF